MENSKKDIVISTIRIRALKGVTCVLSLGSFSMVVSSSCALSYLQTIFSWFLPLPVIRNKHVNSF